MFFDKIFVKNAKSDAKTLFERPKSEKIDNRKNAEILAYSVKSGLFGIQNRKTQLFSR